MDWENYLLMCGTNLRTIYSPTTFVPEHLKQWQNSGLEMTRVKSNHREDDGWRHNEAEDNKRLMDMLLAEQGMVAAQFQWGSRHFAETYMKIK